MIKRIVRFVKKLYKEPDFYFRSPIYLHNLKACWIQSDPDWLSKLGSSLEMSDEEWELFEQATKGE